jgi:hypothetical protein
MHLISRTKTKGLVSEQVQYVINSGQFISRMWPVRPAHSFGPQDLAWNFGEWILYDVMFLTLGIYAHTDNALLPVAQLFRLARQNLIALRKTVGASTQCGEEIRARIHGGKIFTVQCWRAKVVQKR